MANYVKQFTDLLKPKLNKFNYPCFAREINKVVLGKHFKGIREMVADCDRERIDNAYQLLIAFIENNPNCSDIDLMVEIRRMQKRS